MRARCGLFLMIDVALVHPPAHTYRGRRRCVWGGACHRVSTAYSPSRGISTVLVEKPYIRWTVDWVCHSFWLTVKLLFQSQALEGITVFSGGEGSPQVGPQVGSSQCAAKHWWPSWGEADHGCTQLWQQRCVLCAVHLLVLFPSQQKFPERMCFSCWLVLGSTGSRAWSEGEREGTFELHSHKVLASNSVVYVFD